jgi:hypothetical protein
VTGVLEHVQASARDPLPHLANVLGLDDLVVLAVEDKRRQGDPAQIILW